jgi:predicted NBD/HSP70 family sugar kinase
MEPADGPARYRASTTAVLEFAWDAEAFRADHVIAALGLTRTTALSAIDELIEVGLIQELSSSSVEEKGYRLGRPARRFELCRDAGVVVGLDAGDSHFTAVAADLTGRILAREQIGVRGFPGLKGHPDPEGRRGAAFGVIDAVLAAAERTRDEVIGVGVGVPAPADGRGMSPPHQHGFWEHMNAGLGTALAKAFPAVRVENDAGLAAIAEGSVGQARRCNHYVAMLSGRRLGSGVVLEGRLVRGAHGGVGELEGLSYVRGVGSTLGLGVLTEEWVRAAVDDGRVPPDHPWSRLAVGDLTAEAVLLEARMSDPVSRPLLEELGATLGRICSVISRFYDPEMIVVCGAMAAALGDVIEIARSNVATQLELPPPAIVASAFGGDVVSLGAISGDRPPAAHGAPPHRGVRCRLARRPVRVRPATRSRPRHVIHHPFAVTSVWAPATPNPAVSTGSEVPSRVRILRPVGPSSRLHIGVAGSPVLNSKYATKPPPTSPPTATATGIFAVWQATLEQLDRRATLADLAVQRRSTRVGPVG